MIWDTTKYFLSYDKNIGKIYISNFKSSRKNYFKIIEKTSKKKFKNIDWWVSPLGERNNYSSQLFHYICIIDTLKIIKKKKIGLKKIVSDNIFLIKLLKKNFPKYEFFLKKKKRNYSYFNFIFKHIIIFILSKLYKKSDRFLNFKKDLVLVDKFISSTNINEDRYYNNFFDKGKKNAVYLPTIVNLNIKEIYIIIKKIQKSNKYFNKFDLLSFRDFLFSLNFLIRRKKLLFKNILYNKIDISDLINSEINSNLNLNASIIGIQNYLFAKKLNEKKLSIKKIINWFENTAVDKGLNFGVKKYLKNVELIGYQGFTTYKEFMCLDPLSYEKKFNVIPDKIICIGKNLILAKKELFHNLSVKLGPALRFDHVHKNYKKKRFTNSVLVNLNLDYDSSKLIIENLIKTEFYKKFGGKLFIKSHPLLDIKKIIDINNKKNIYLIKGNIYKLASKFKVAVSSGATSSIVETIVAGCKMCFPFDNFTDAYSLKLIKTPKSCYKVCKSTNELSNYLSFNTNKGKNNEMGFIKFKKNIFNKSNKKYNSLLV